MRTPTVLTIAGSDSGGAAGIQADLKAFARCGVHGTSAITALTAQNTLGVSAVQHVAPEMILAQVRAVLCDIGADAVKVGMLGSVATAQAVAKALRELPADTPVVVDPVMVAESGAALLEPSAREVLAQQIVPCATVLTPNLLEARELGAGSGQSRQGESAQRAGVGRHAGPHAQAAHAPGEAAGEAERLIRAVLALGPRCVVLTGGHREQAVDLFLQAGAEEIVRIGGERHRSGAAHGSGCTHSSLLAAALALGQTPLQAARFARELAGEAVARGLQDVGAGAGPVDVLGLAGRRPA